MSLEQVNYQPESSASLTRPRALQDAMFEECYKNVSANDELKILQKDLTTPGQGATAALPELELWCQAHSNDGDAQKELEQLLTQDPCTVKGANSAVVEELFAAVPILDNGTTAADPEAERLLTACGASIVSNNKVFMTVSINGEPNAYAVHNFSTKANCLIAQEYASDGTAQWVMRDLNGNQVDVSQRSPVDYSDNGNSSYITFTGVRNYYWWNDSGLSQTSQGF